ncbi:hypothetical protein [Janibacter cremeus]|uniref:Transmembrane protein n=1 Tax=Janibacter cremeus TaxID=1285192 RepID=A0A852VRF4_9MICO|nr:hypothetical protein [Janibacter cremeus]NYF99597.1 hypothetical protein [Janibacter cremeus]
MNEHTEATSTTRQIAPLAIILGIPLIFAAVFFYTSPVVLETGGQQGIFKCGSPSSPNTDAKNVCNDPETVARNKAIYSGLSGVSLVGLGAFWLLRGRRDDEDWDDDRPRRRGHDDIDLRADTRDRDEDLRDRGDDVPPTAERSEGLRGVDNGRDRAVDDDLDVADSRTARRRRGGRRSVLRDDDFASPAPRRRADDDWSSDGWR